MSAGSGIFLPRMSRCRGRNMNRLPSTWLLSTLLCVCLYRSNGLAFITPSNRGLWYTVELSGGSGSLSVAHTTRRNHGGPPWLRGCAPRSRHLKRQRAFGGSAAVKMELSADDGGGVREGLARQEFTTLLAEGNVKRCAQLIRQWGTQLDVSMADAEALLTAASKEPVMQQPMGDESIILVYKALKDAGILRAFGSIDLDIIPTKSPGVMPETRLTELTGMDMKSLSPSRRTGVWAFAGFALFGLQYAMGKALGVDPLQTFIPLTLGLVLVDRIFIRGAILGTIVRAVVPGYKERIVKHEAGHFLVAYLLGCPVQGCVLDPFEIGKYAGGSAQGGTMFADPAFADGMARGKLTNSIINRFSIVLMGGIAAEAIHFGSSEGGASDEGVLVQILTTISPPFNIQQIKNLALWAAVQAVLLIREHKDAYDELVEALDRGASLGECVVMLETELSKKPLPGDLRRETMKPSSPADEMRAMMVRRMSQQYAKSEGEGDALTTRAGLEAVDRKMLDLQRKVEDLERGDAVGKKVEEMGFKADSGGIWLNDLAAVRGDDERASTRAFVEDLTASAAASTVTGSGSGTTPGAIVDGSVEVPPVGGGDASAAAGSEGSTPDGGGGGVAVEAESEADRRLRELDMQAAENAKRLAEIEARMRRLEGR